MPPKGSVIDEEDLSLKFQKKTQHQLILDLPDTYLGSNQIEKGLYYVYFDDEEKIIFFQPDRSPFLEYDLNKIVTNLANPNRRIVGLYTNLPMLGTFNPLAKSQDAAAAPPWAVYNQMKEFFEIKRILEKTK